MSLSSIIICSNRLVSRIITAKICDGSRLKWRPVMSQRALSQLQRKDEETFDPDKPVVFSSSPAAISPKLVIVNRVPVPDIERMPWHHPHATLISSLIFIIYFFYLREENDIDLAISGSNTEEYAKKIYAMQKAAEAEERKKGANRTW
ncbi:unnamed protein product [Bemisia tabaci]|uniref:Uncharacterized protein n=1 Tax=Bemisia tabaci TaxID=7038 RepID=A0A9P0AND9_BEMTA|nr:unnamed protein product [Bemisia tabaci]